MICWLGWHSWSKWAPLYLENTCQRIGRIKWCKCGEDVVRINQTARRSLRVGTNMTIYPVRRSQVG